MTPDKQSERIDSILASFAGDLNSIGRYLGATYDNAREKAKKAILAELDKARAQVSMPIINDAWCIACGHPTLFLGEGGFITCSLEGCPDPTAMHRAIVQLQAKEQAEKEAILLKILSEQ